MKVSVRFSVLNRDGFRCRYCGAESEGFGLEVDHVVPLARGGKDELSNLVTACVRCNRGKASRGVTLPPASRLNGFTAWLAAQRGRNCWVGDFADDFAKDPMLQVSSYRHLAKRMREMGVGRRVRHVAWHAWREFVRGRPTIVTSQILARDIEAVMNPGNGYTNKQGSHASPDVIRDADRRIAKIHRFLLKIKNRNRRPYLRGQNA